jgi:hypothetical protein
VWLHLLSLSWLTADHRRAEEILITATVAGLFDTKHSPRGFAHDTKPDKTIVSEALTHSSTANT